MNLTREFFYGKGRKKKRPRRFGWMYRDDSQEVSEEIRQVYLELTTECNFSCRTCVRFSIDGFRAAPMDMKLFASIMSDLKKQSSLERVVLLGFGEALCHPRIKDILTELGTLPAEVLLVTNASLLTEELTSLISQLPRCRVVISWDDSINSPGRVIRRGKNQNEVRENIQRITDSLHKTGSVRVGMQIVAMKGNRDSLRDIIRFGADLGIDHFLVSNLFPYSEDMAEEILYFPPVTKKETLRALLKKEARKYSIEIAASLPDRSRRCPFIEKGTLFITAKGEAAPCPELAYTHQAWYYGKPRIHNRHIFGSVNKNSMEDIWQETTFRDYRNNFLYWDFPDCSSCQAQGSCGHRESGTDCYWNPTPCGECLWAKEIIICP